MARANSNKSDEFFFARPQATDGEAREAASPSNGDSVGKLSLKIQRLEGRIKVLEARRESKEVSSHAMADAWLERTDLHQAIKRTFRERAARKKFFPSEFVTGEPCWDILLDLAASWIEGKRISITSACIASGAPNTTALRWISIMECANLVVREQDERDSRRTFLSLTPEGFKAIADYFRYIGVITSPPG